MNATAEKILIIIKGSFALGFCYTPRLQNQTIKEISREWEKINKKEFSKEISNLYRYKFIKKNKNKDGSINILITEKGKFKALNLILTNIKNKKERWDGKWRMVAFDVPEKYKKGRDSLRRKLKEIGFCEMQKSVFVAPYNCIDEMSQFVDFFQLRKYVRLGVLEFIDNEGYFKNIFKIV